MVNLIELKPRNLLTDPEFEDQIVEVIQININNGNDGIVDEGGYVYNTDLRKLNPIPLTKNILIACGFKYGKTKGVTRFVDDISDINPEDKNEYTHYWDKEIKQTEIVDSHNICIVKWGEQEYFTFQLERGNYRRRIEHLHQLQNLYFALTGKELNYSPIKK